ncbi:MAG: hypothetical protein IJ131_10625, partial [Eggerthellaceae bacterium]|nr:hypothetical protein [Eggerthellaceae bacterium]
EAASGDSVLRVDSDDAIPADACAQLLRAAKGANADMVWGDYTNRSLFRGPVAELAARGTVDMWRSMRCALESGLFMITPCVQLVRLQFLKDNGIVFDEGRIFEDQLWLMRLLLCGATVLRVDVPFYTYHIGDHPSSTTRITPKRLMDAVDVIYAMIAEIERYRPPDNVRAVAEAYVANCIAILSRTFICHAPKRFQDLVRLRLDEKYAYYAAQTQLLPQDARTIGPAFVNYPDLFEKELARIRAARKANDATGAKPSGENGDAASDP